MLTIRLQRVGRKGDPSYRIVATDSRSGPKTNKHRALLGSYDTIRKTFVVNDPEEVKKFIAHGAQLTDTVHNLFVSHGIIEGKKKNALPKKSPIVDEEALAREAEEKARAEEEAQKAKEAEAQAEVSEDENTEADSAEESSAQTETAVEEKEEEEAPKQSPEEEEEKTS